MGITSGKSVGLSGGSFVRLGRITSGAEGVEIGSVSLTGGISVEGRSVLIGATRVGTISSS